MRIESSCLLMLSFTDANAVHDPHSQQSTGAEPMDFGEVNLLRELSIGAGSSRSREGEYAMAKRQPRPTNGEGISISEAMAPTDYRVIAVALGLLFMITLGISTD